MPASTFMSRRAQEKHSDCAKAEIPRANVVCSSLPSEAEAESKFGERDTVKREARGEANKVLKTTKRKKSVQREHTQVSRLLSAHRFYKSQRRQPAKILRTTPFFNTIHPRKQSPPADLEKKQTKTKEKTLSTKHPSPSEWEALICNSHPSTDNTQSQLPGVEIYK